MSAWHYAGCGCTKDSDYQEIDTDGEYCDECILGGLSKDELPERIIKIMGDMDE